MDVQLYVLPTSNSDPLSDVSNGFTGSVRQQQGHNLGERMANAFADNLPTYSRAILVGCDCPGLTRDHYRQVVADLEHYDAVVIPALDGGYVLMGLRHADKTVFRDIDWGTDQVMAQTRQQFRKAGLSWQEHSPLPDIDRPDDLQYCPETILTGVTREVAG